MLPIMGLAFGVSVGDRSAIFSTLLVSLTAIVTAVAVEFVLTLPVAQVMKPEAIQQIMIRTSPHLLDLMAALVTDLAGAFALSRRDVSDTLRWCRGWPMRGFSSLLANPASPPAARCSLERTTWPSCSPARLFSA